MKLNQHSTDEALIDGCINGNRLAQKYLYLRYAGKVMSICMRYTQSKEEAKEVLNTGFMKVFESLGNYKSTGPLSGWIARIVFRSAIDHVRAHTRYKSIMDFNIEKDQPIENEAMSNLGAGELYGLIQQLPPATQAVFSMYAIDGYKHSEIAKKLGISEGTSKWHLSTARKTLQTLFQENVIQP